MLVTNTDNFRGTYFSNHTTSLLLQNESSILGTQTHTQNCWGANAGAAVYGEDVLVSLDYADQYPFLVDIEIVDCFMPTSHLPMGWFQDEPVGSSGEACSTDDCIILKRLSPESDDVKRIARGDTAVTAAVVWELQRYIYEQLQSETVGDTAILSFLAKADTNTIGAFYAINQSISALFTADTTAIEQWQANLRLVEEKLDSMAIIDGMLPEADSIETISLWNERAALVNTLFDLDEDNRDIVEDIWEYIADEADKLRDQNDSIAVSEVYEINEKEVNGVHLSWLSTVLGALDSLQLATLESIAEQCPFTGGNAVYRARALLGAATQVFVTYNDSLLCISAELLSIRPENELLIHAEKEEAVFNIYPNPASEEVNIAWSAPSDNPGVLQIFDVFGRQMQQLVLSPGTTVHTLNVRDFPEGLYIFRIRFQGWDAIRKIIITR
jgi:hypothetical protein